MYPYIYRNKLTGQKVYSYKELKDKDLEIVFTVKKTVIDKPVIAKKYGCESYKSIFWKYESNSLI